MSRPASVDTPADPLLAHIRDALARTGLAIGDAPLPDRLGADRLHRHQRLAVARLRAALDSLGGALLADAVGLGKTHVALTLAREARAPLVVTPAALRPTWTAAARQAGVTVRLVSAESLGRSDPRSADTGTLPDLVVVDEAHHFRNAATRRWQRLATLTRHARVLLLTATPVHNAARDLVALLALFLGDRARTLDAATLARLVVRRRPADLAAYRQHPTDDTPARPPVARTSWHPLSDDQPLLDALLTIPPPVPPRDGGHAGALVTMSLVRLWASSDAALRAALHRRLTRAAALESALADGRHLTRRELAAWCPDDTTLQLGLALDLTDASAGPSGPSLHDALAAHAAGCRQALTLLDARSDRDAHRAAWLRALREQHRDRVIVAFTQFADTARALYRRLAPDGRVALLTAAGGRIASGPIPRHELLAQLAVPHPAQPPADAAPSSARIDHVALLIATDCLAEGLDLRAASVVVHLDIPWTPARLAQRVGRAARLDAPHPCIFVHGLSPPVGVAAWLQLGARLRRKATAARSLLGAHSASTSTRGDTSTGDPLPRGARPVRQDRQADATLHAHLRLARLLERWVRLADGAAAPAGPRIIAVAADHPGFLAACTLDGAFLLVASDRRGRGSADPRHVVRAIRALHRADAPCALVPAARRHLVATVRQTLARWARRRRARDAAGAALGPATPALTGAALRDLSAGSRVATPSSIVRMLLARAASAVASAPAAHRASIAAKATELRVALQRPLGAGVERALAALSADLPDRDWLAAAHAAVRPTESPARHLTYGEPAPRRPVRLLALVLLVP